MQNTNDPYAITQIANTYGTTQYLYGDIYVKSGVFSHWFYLLVSGGSGTNGIGNSYNVSGIGMDAAEKLIVEAVFSGKLRNTSSYSQIRDAFVQAGYALQGVSNSVVVTEAEKAFYAVGVGTPPVTISGPIIHCPGPQSYSVTYAPAGFSWTSSPNISIFGSGTNITASGTASGAGYIAIKNNLGQIIKKQDVSVVMASIFGSTSVLINQSNSYVADNVCLTPSASSYQWSVSGAASNYSISPVSGTNYANITFYNAGSYTVSVTMSGSGSSAYCTLGVNVTRGASASPFKVYPNPADNILYIDVDQQAILANSPAGSLVNKNPVCEFRLFSLMGVIVLQSTSSSNKVQLNVSNLPDGIYFLHLYDGISGMPEIKQVVIKH